MVRLFPIIFIFILVFCNNRNQKIKDISKDTSIQLIDNLGSISLNFPDHCDTFLTWIRLNDCGKPCEEGKYRFQSKNLPIFKESGFYWTGQPEDSVNQLTISHHRPDTLLANDDSFALKNSKRFKENLGYDPENAMIISDTIQKINDRSFCIFKINGLSKKKKIMVKRLVAFTFIRGNTLQFQYDIKTSQQDSIFYQFFDNALRNLKTVRVIDGR